MYRTVLFFYQAEEGKRDRSPYRGLGDVYKGQYQGIGAYNDDGTLKANAKVLYITAATAKTVTTTLRVDKKDVEKTG